MRVTTAFNKLLAIAGASVAAVDFEPEGVIVSLHRRRRRPVCPCGWKGRAVYDRSIRRWRHLDLGGSKLLLSAEIRRIHCRRCDRVRTEAVDWARSGARLTRDFEDVVAWLAQRTDKTTVARLLRTSWETVARAVERVVVDHIDEHRLDGLFHIGVDEVSYRKGHRFLTVVADHGRQGAVVWAGEGRKAETMERFYDELGEERCAQLEAVSRDMGPAYKAATDRKAPAARQCIDPFHVIKLANLAIDETRLEEYRQVRATTASVTARRGRPQKGSPPNPHAQARWTKHTKWPLIKDPDDLKDRELEVLHQLRRAHSPLYRAWQLKEGLRDLYRLKDPQDAPIHLDWWLAWAARSRIKAFVRLGRTIRANRTGILDAIELGLSNSKLEGLNSKIRLINHRGYGHHSAAAVIAMIYLCCGGVTVALPFKSGPTQR